MEKERFKNRVEAGDELAKRLENYETDRATVYALPRGGVIVAGQISKKLSLPLDIVISRKISHPDNPEYAVAAVSEKGEIVYNPKETIQKDEVWFNLAVERAKHEAERRREVYSKNKQRSSARGRTAILVDDGAATGLTILSAIREIRNDIPWKIVVALPVLPSSLCPILEHEADELVVIVSDPDFKGSVGQYYDDFDQVGDVDVMRVLGTHE